jgi:GAF domain-containing protein
VADGPDIPHGVAAEFATLAQELLDVSTVHEVLTKVATSAQAVIPGAEVVSLTLRREDGGLDTAVATAPLARELDGLQYELGEGPILVAFESDGLGLAEAGDLADDERFPRWAPAATDAGIRDVLMLGLFPKQAPPRLGTLNVYTSQPNGLNDVDRDIAVILAAHASTALAGTLATSSAELEKAQLVQAVSSRDVIGQAKGILMERRGISADEAFALLREASQSLNLKLVKVAETLATRRADI